MAPLSRFQPRTPSSSIEITFHRNQKLLLEGDSIQLLGVVEIDNPVVEQLYTQPGRCDERVVLQTGLDKTPTSSGMLRVEPLGIEHQSLLLDLVLPAGDEFLHREAFAGE